MPKVAIITGASSGIGKGLAERYSQAGYNVGLIARRKSELLALQSSLPTKTLIGVCDVSQKCHIFMHSKNDSRIRARGCIDCQCWHQ